MPDFTTLNTQFLISLIVIFIGFTLKSARIVDKEGGGKALVRIIFNVTLPSLILCTFTRIQIDVAMIAMPFLDLLITGIVLSSAWFIHMKEPVKQRRGQFIMMSLGYNVGNFAFPLIQGTFGDEGLKYAAMYDVGNTLVIFLICYIIAVYFSAREGERISRAFVLQKVFTSPPLLSYIIGMILSGLGLRFPEFLSNATATGVLDVIAKANSFISFLVLGIYLDFNLDRTYWKNILKVMITRYSIGMALGMTVFVLWDGHYLARTILLICYTLPVGLGLLVFVVQFGYDEKFAGMLSNLMNIISFGLIWLILLTLSSWSSITNRTLPFLSGVVH